MYDATNRVFQLHSNSNGVLKLRHGWNITLQSCTWIKSLTVSRIFMLVRPSIVTPSKCPFEYGSRYLYIEAETKWPPFPDDIFKCIFLNQLVKISIAISLKFVAKGPVNYIAALVQIMAWHRRADKPLSKPMMVSLLTHICVTRPQWV